MKRPWQIWSMFALCLMLVVPAMSWLTVKAMELDRAELVARLQAQREEDIGRALWRMDAELTRLLSPEIARPFYAYQPFYSGTGSQGQAQLTASPLLLQQSDYVLLHFQMTPTHQISSPQCPTGFECNLAIDRGVDSSFINQHADRLDQLQQSIDYEALLAQLPEQVAPAEPLPPATTLASTPKMIEPPVVKNTLDFSQVQQQLNVAELPEESQLPPQPLPKGMRDALRGKLELENRGAYYQAMAQQMVGQRRDGIPSLDPQSIKEGVSQPVWVGPHLLLARRVQVGDQTLVQGAWLNWPLIQSDLRAKIADLVPHAQLVPVTATTGSDQIRLSRLLATVPVQLLVPSLEVHPVGLSPIRVSLIIAWICLVLAAAAVAVLLSAVVVLSERRATFVSAVTHELRTPLTTFRIYSDMLCEGMVTDAQQRQQYLETLRGEADRLAHLVENVLQYARLERGRHAWRREAVMLDDFLDRMEMRLSTRAARDQMQLVLDNRLPRSTELRTNSGAVEQILLNLVDNACKYASAAADRRIHLLAAADAQSVRLTVRDHGPGIARPQRRRLFRPFSKSVDEAAQSAPGVGLGLALSRRLARQLGGSLELRGSQGAGAEFVLKLPR